MAGHAEWGSDVIVEMMQAYGIQYAPTNLGGTFRGLLDSIVNFGGNESPEVIECLHEETAVCVAHGYAAVSGKPAVALVHNVVGTLHAAMAIYDAYAAKAPVIVMSGTGPMRLPDRRPWIDWVHTANVQGNLVRDYVKWDDQPTDAASFPESFARAYRVAMTDPKGPVYIALDAGWQEGALSEPVAIPDVGKFEPPGRMQGDPALVRRAAEWIAQAQLPVIVAGRLGRSDAATASLIELAEIGHIPVIDAGGGLSFPNTHHFDATGTDLLEHSDVVLLLEVDQAENTLRVTTRYPRGTGRSRLEAGCKVINVGVGDLLISKTTHEFGRLYPFDLAIGGDPSLVVAQLAAELKRLFEASSTKNGLFEARETRVADARAAARARWHEEAQREADARPISLPRLAQEVWDCVKGESFVLSGNAGGWTRRLWQLERPSQTAGAGGAAALGTGLPKAIGAALAAKDQGAFSVDFNGDGDFLYGPSAIWTAVHHHLPTLLFVLNNGGYIGEGGHVVWTAQQRERSTDHSHIAVEIQRPGIDFASMARAQGAYAEGPIEDPDQLRPAIQRALKVMKEQRTLALVDVRCGG